MDSRLWDQLDHFTKEEFVCKCGCGQEDMNFSFMIDIDDLRDELEKKCDGSYNFTITPSSGYRCPTHNKNEGGSETSYHLRGFAIDILCSGTKAYEIGMIAFAMNFTGIRIKQSGEHNKRFIHLDKRPRSKRHLGSY